MSSTPQDRLRRAVDWLFDKICYDPDIHYLLGGRDSAGAEHVGVIMAGVYRDRTAEEWRDIIAAAQVPSHRVGTGYVAMYQDLREVVGRAGICTECGVDCEGHDD